MGLSRYGYKYFNWGLLGEKYSYVVYKSQTPKMQECMYNEGLPLVWGLGFRVQVGSEGLEQHPLVAPVDCCTVI